MYRRSNLALSVLSLLILGVGCPSAPTIDAGDPFNRPDQPPVDAGIVGDAGSNPDAGANEDAGEGEDAGVENDAGVIGDAGELEDAGVTDDAGEPEDAGEAEDAGGPDDAGEAEDAGGPEDAGVGDGGVISCDEGYAPNASGSCVDIDECAENTFSCDALTTCTNTDGGFDCGPCPDGFLGEGVSRCIDVNECATENGGCEFECENQPGTFVCDCPDGAPGNLEIGCFTCDETIRIRNDAAISQWQDCEVVTGDLIIEDISIDNVDFLAGIREIGGDLRVVGTEVSDFSGFSLLESVGSVTLENNDQALNFEGFNRLTNVQDLIIDSNFDLESLAGFNGITTVAGDLRITWNFDLRNMVGLNALRMVEGEFEIATNSTLRSLNGLQQLESVGSLDIDSGWLSSLSPLSSLNEVGSLRLIDIDISSLDTLSFVSGHLDRLVLSDLRRLTSLEALANVTSVNTLMIGDVPLLESLDGLEGITGPLDGSLGLFRLPLVTDLSPVSGITAVEYLTISNLPGVTTLEDIQVATVEETFYFSDMALVDFSGMSALTSAKLIWIDSPTIESTNGLSHLEHGGFWILECPNFEAFSGLTSLQSVTQIRLRDTLVSDLSVFAGMGWPSGVTIEDNPNLTSLVGLDGISGGNVAFRRNDGITSLAGVTIVAPDLDSLHVVGNALLEEIDALSGVESAYNVIIRDNPVLTSYAGLSSLLRASGPPGLVLTGNPLADPNTFSELEHVSALVVQGHATLTNLDGLSGLSYIFNEAQIDNNPLLTNIDGLLNLADLGALTVTANPLLPACNVDEVASALGLPLNDVTNTGNDEDGICN